MPPSGYVAVSNNYVVIIHIKPPREKLSTVSPTILYTI